jgi:hypothetical protein
MKAYSALIPLKPRLLLLPMILATTAAMGDTLPGSPADSHAQAAALLSRPQIVGSMPADRSVSSPSTATEPTDAQALAAALLSRPRMETPAQATVPAKAASRSADGQARLPHVLFLEDANGNAFQLMHSPGQGWKYLAAAKSEGVARTLSARKLDLSPVAASYAETTPPGADPMAVFIDGPTGYAFAWNADPGWKFVGHLTEQHR